MYQSIKMLHDQLKNKQITPSQLIQQTFVELKKVANLNASILELEEQALSLAKELDKIPVPDNNYLFAIPYAVKDNFATKGIKTTACSNILANFVPEYNAKVIQLLEHVQTVLISKTALDELGMGGHGLYANTGYVYNPWDLSRIIGGSSSGSAALVASGVIPFALGSDTGDSIRKPASYAGIIGFKPTYGLISRFGLFPYAPSLDTVGYFARTVEDSAIILDYLVNYDEFDSTAQISSEKEYFANFNPLKKNYKIAYVKEIHNHLPNNLQKQYENFYHQLRLHNNEVQEVSISEQLLKAILPVYMVISYAEAVSSHANLTGINFGVRKEGHDYQEVMINSRKQGFGKVVKRRYVIGSYVLSKNNQKLLFIKAKKIRAMFVNELKKIFNNYDILVLPSSFKVAPKIKEIEQEEVKIDDIEHYVDDVLILGNFMGNPSITLPFILEQGLPIGINFNSAPFTEQKLLNFAGFCEKLINFQNLEKINQGGNKDE